MYFDLAPKTDKVDLYGQEYHLELFKSYLRDHSVRMIVIRGLRRVGKTSLLNVALGEAAVPSVLIDVRQSPFQDRREFLLFLARKIKEKVTDRWEKIMGKIAGVGLGYEPFSLELFFSREENIGSFFEQLNGQLAKNKAALILAFDEVQLLKPIGFDYFLAGVFDHYRQIKIVVTGSEIGLMDTFLGKESYEAPLFGRAYLEITVGKIKEEALAQFLEAGFKQIRQPIGFQETKEVIDHFDGIIGWATQYGWFRWKGFPHRLALQKVQEEGKIIVRKEFDNFLGGRRSKNNYLKSVRYLAKGKNTWSLLKQAFLKEGIRISDSQLGLYLSELTNYGFVEKLNEQYFLVDPLLSHI